MPTTRERLFDLLVDLTANTDRNDDISITDLPLEPVQPERVVRALRNLRDPRLNLDSLYGNGPAASGPVGEVPYQADGRRLVLGALSAPKEAFLPVPGAAEDDDLPRVECKAQIGDGRNDENLVVAQLHVAFLKFHNAVVDYLVAHPDAVDAGDGGFEAARQLVRWHYQWITMHDFLKRVAEPDVVNGLLDGRITPRFRIDQATPREQVFMPLEFSVAAFRFGHSMVRAAYDWNVNFGTSGETLQGADLGLLFFFTGGGGLSDGGQLPANWPAQFERLTGVDPRPGGTPATVPLRFARKIDTQLSPPLAVLANQGVNEVSLRIQRILQRLAVRNLLRGYRLALPTGQAVARALGLEPLRITDTFGGQPAVDDALVDGGFVEARPLWFYVLKEAEVLGKGQRLGPVGSRIIAETVIGQLRADEDSFVNRGWSPKQGARRPRRQHRRPAAVRG